MRNCPELVMISDQLRALGLSKAEFAREIGYSPEQVSRWKDNVPLFARRYLELRIRHERLKEEMLSLLDGY